MNEKEIISRIEYHIRQKSFMNFLWGYKSWNIGVSENPELKFKSFGHPSKWKWYKAASVEVAYSVYLHFFVEGMKDKGCEPDGIYVYIY